MSSNPIVVSETSSPFVTTTTLNIETANRLIGLRAHPGFNDLLRISQELVQEAQDVCMAFGGWDPQQFTVLLTRLQTAKQFHQALVLRIQEKINIGVTEAKEQIEALLAAHAPVITADEMVDQGDYVRQRVLQSFAEKDDDALRIAGSH